MKEFAMIIVNILFIYLNISFVFLLFLKVSGIILSINKTVLLTTVGLLVILLTGNYVQITEPAYFICLSFYFNNRKGLPLNIFYGLLPLVISSLFRRTINYFVVPLLFHNSSLFLNNLFNLHMISFLGVFISFIFLAMLHYDFGQLKMNLTDKITKKVLIPIDISMIFYYVVTQILLVIQDSYSITTSRFMKMIVIIYLICFFMFIAVLDRYVKQHIQDELVAQKEGQLSSLSQYSRHIESLYKEIRSFRHDYTNILTSLRLGIENKDLASIEQIYHQVLKETGQQLQDNRYDIERLGNIQNDAVKSVLSAKILEAQNKKIAIEIEIPEEITNPKMGLLDFITILSILCDNAIEAALEAAQSKINLAFFAQNNQSVFIIQNTTKEQQINISKIFKEGYSSRGSNRGIGLAKVSRILSYYPTASLQTKSQDYTFKQILIVTK